MSLPPSFLEELRDRITLSQVVGRKVTWDQRRSNAAKGDWWAPCPFHQEKTASFHVDDRKGFYYCFGCQAKGDAIGFVRESENVDFIEAVRILAREAGMSLPEQDPQAGAVADRNARLIAANEAAARFYRMQLSTAAAAEARAYLERRGLSPAMLERFGIGYAPDARQALWGHLTGQGMPPEDIVDAGLAARPEDGGTPFDRFRGRIVFPIRDARGRCIALGGRALRADARAKYLNSPETPVFDKGRSLYNLGPARAAVGAGQPLVVAEGYMDVIALTQAGFEAAVAPLGTAVTADQIQAMWRVAGEPVIALDGDAAGMRAAERLIDLALPLIGAGRGLRFALLPEGQDPDDLIRGAGPGAMRALIDGAEPMVRLLWRRETEGTVLDSPERRAGLDARLRKLLGRIPDAAVRAHYAAELRELRAALFSGRRRAPPGRRRREWPGMAAPATPLAATRRSRLAGASDAVADECLIEAVILATMITHPDLVGEFAGEIEALDCAEADHRLLQGALVTARDGDEIARRLARGPLAEARERLLRHSHVRIVPAIRSPGDNARARRTLEEELAKLRTRRGARRERDEAMLDATALRDEGVTWRLGQAAVAAAEIGRGVAGDPEAEGEEAARLAVTLDQLIERQVWVKRKR